jgi:hypothetical protein
MNTPPVFSYLSFSDNEARLGTYVRKCREEDKTEECMSSVVEIYGSACEGLRFRSGRTAIETTVEVLVRHLPRGVFREKDFNKYDYFSKKAKN